MSIEQLIVRLGAAMILFSGVKGLGTLADSIEEGKWPLATFRCLVFLATLNVTVFVWRAA